MTACSVRGLTARQRIERAPSPWCAVLAPLRDTDCCRARAATYCRSAARAASPPMCPSATAARRTTSRSALASRSTRSCSICVPAVLANHCRHACAWRCRSSTPANASNGSAWPVRFSRATAAAWATSGSAIGQRGQQRRAPTRACRRRPAPSPRPRGLRGSRRCRLLGQGRRRGRDRGRSPAAARPRSSAASSSPLAAARPAPPLPARRWPADRRVSPCRLMPATSR